MRRTKEEWKATLYFSPREGRKEGKRRRGRRKSERPSSYQLGSLVSTPNNQGPLERGEEGNWKEEGGEKIGSRRNTKNGGCLSPLLPPPPLWVVSFSVGKIAEQDLKRWKKHFPMGHSTYINKQVTLLRYTGMRKTLASIRSVPPPR